MQHYRVSPYKSSDKGIWDAFILKSNQDTFLFFRDFMDYHSDRFQDYSLMIYSNDKLIALLPANKDGNVVYSHQGLSFGGLIYKGNLKTLEYIEIYKAILEFLNENNVSELHLKELPVVYQLNPTNNPLSYMCFKVRAKLHRTDIYSIIDQKFKTLSSSRKEGLKRGIKHNLRVEEVDDFDLFWNSVLIPNLKSKHGVKPVHSLDEIKLLKSRFPDNIRQFNAYSKNDIVAGVTVFENEQVVHCQYISGTDNRSELGSLDFLHVHLVEEVFAHKSYFSFGTSNTNQGQQINKGLQFWKEGFGARSITQNFYSIETGNYRMLDDVAV